MTLRARVYIVRHGETQENRQGIVQGQLDSSLNNLGLQQAQLVANALKRVPFDRAYSSDLRRASKTAEEILNHHPDVLLVKHSDLRERYFGDLQGQPVHTKQQAVANGCGKLVEPGILFAARAESWWLKSLLGDIATLPQRSKPYYILVVSHGGFIGTLLKVLLHDGRMKCATPGMITGKCTNTSISIVEIDDDNNGILVQYSDITHLEDLAETVVRGNADVELGTK